MKKRFWLLLLTILVALCIVAGAVACGEKDARLVSIQIDRNSLKTSYTVGETPSLEGAKLLLTYSDGSTQTVALTESMLSAAIDTAAEGSHSVIISYNDQSLRFAYTVAAATKTTNATSVTLEGVKTEYKLNEAMSYEGTLNATFDDGTSATWNLADISRVIKVEGFRTDKAGNMKCQISYDSGEYGMVSVTYNYVVKPLARIKTAVYTYTQPLKIFMDSTAGDFAKVLAEHPFEITYEDDTTQEVTVSNATYVDSAFTAATVGNNYSVYVTVTDGKGRSTRVLVPYAVIQRYDVYTVIFNPNFEGAAPCSKETDPATGKVAPETYENRGYTFLGWFVGSVNGQKFNFTNVVEGNMTLVAKWQLNEYSIKITSFGATYGSTRYYNYEKTVVLDAPAEVEGYEFLYYTVKGTDGTILVNNTITAGEWAQDLELEAKWRAIQYDLTFDLHGNTSYPVDDADGEQYKKRKYTTEETAALPIPSRPGYDFAGWSLEQPARRYVSTMRGVLGDQTLHANWTEKSYYVTFVQVANTQDGLVTVGAIPGQKKFSAGTPKDEIKPAQLAGYRFEGWYSDEACTTQFYNEDGVYYLQRGQYTADFTLYALTTPVFTLYLEREDREDKDAFVFAVSDEGTAAYNAAWAAAGERSNCDIDYWYYQGNATLAELRLYMGEDGPSLAADDLAAYNGKTLVAHWKGRKHNVTYRYYKVDDSTYNEQTVEYDTYLGFVLPTPERGGYEFLGWYRSESLQGDTVSEVYSCDYDRDLYFFAKWEMIEYTLCFHYGIGADLLKTKLNGVTATDDYTVDTLVYRVTDPLFAFSTVTAKYNNFGGWRTADKVVYGQLDTGTYGVTDLYASWSPCIYYIDYERNGGTYGAEPTYMVDYNSTEVVMPEPTRVGYNLVGWYYDAEFGRALSTNAQGKYVLNVQSILTAGDEPQPETTIVTVYAKWEAIEYTITYQNGRTVTYNNNGSVTINSTNIATQSNPAQTTFSADNVLDLGPTGPNVPVCNGYKFEAWYTSTTTSAAKKVDSTEGIYSNLTLYAMWTKGTYTISYDDFSDAEVASLSLPTHYQLGGDYKDSIDAIKNKMKQFGLYLEDVYTDASLEGDALLALGAQTPGAGQPGCQDVTLYGKWSYTNFNISLVYQNRSGLVKVSTASNAAYNYYNAPEWDGAYSRTITLEDIGEKGYQLPQMVNAGYVTQSDWYGSYTGTTNDTFGKPFEAGLITKETLQNHFPGANGASYTIILYSKFVQATYSITYVLSIADAATMTSLPASYNYFSTLSIGNPTYDSSAYKWFGWYTDTTYTTRVQNLNNAGAAGNLVTAQDLTLYGHIEAYHRIIYDYQGATSLSNPVSKFNRAEAQTLPNYTAAVSGKTFSGWYIEGLGNVGTTLPAGVDNDVNAIPLFYNSTTKGILVDYSGETGKIVRYTGTDAAVTAPTLMGTINDFGATPTAITSIADRAFAGCTTLTSVRIEGCSIGKGSYLFDGCTALAEVTLVNCTIASGSVIFNDCTALATLTLDCAYVGSGALAGATNIQSLTVRGALSGEQSLVAMFNTKNGNVTGAGKLTDLHILGDSLSAYFGTNILALAMVQNVYLHAETVVDTGAMGAFLDTRTVYVPADLVTNYSDAHTSWNVQAIE